MEKYIKNFRIVRMLEHALDSVVMAETVENENSDNIILVFIYNGEPVRVEYTEIGVLYTYKGTTYIQKYEAD